MKQSSVIIFSALVFLLALILYRTIFQALGIVLVFIVCSTLIEVIWNLHQSAVLGKILSPIIRLLLSSALAISFYSLFFLPVDFLITEILFKMPKLPQSVGMSVMIISILFFGLIKRQRLFKTRNSYFLILFFLFFSGIFYLTYRKEKLAREYLPKIYRIDPTWGIQGMLVTIDGSNFYQIWRKGKVLIGGEEMNIISWDEKKIVAEVPVPKKFGKVTLVVVREDNFNSNQLDFEKRDPKTFDIGN